MFIIQRKEPISLLLNSINQVKKLGVIAKIMLMILSNVN